MMDTTTDFTPGELKAIAAEQRRNRARMGTRFFKKWTKREVLELSQAVALLLNIDPDRVQQNPDGTFDEGPIFDLVLQRMANAAETGELPTVGGYEQGR